MTYHEYAVRIYCKVFKVETDGGDAYVCGILDAIGELTEREQTALECYYHRGMTYKQTGLSLGGVCGQRASQICEKAL
ncbi:MAG: hypothetical protein LBH95_06310 [Oscillospiraceae bacterium]|nr:hypothetical protein [Oscillospiraceae bacterium]